MYIKKMNLCESVSGMPDTTYTSHLNAVLINQTDRAVRIGTETFYLGIVGGDTRPTTGLHVGLCFFDTTLGKPIWYDGTSWVDASNVSSWAKASAKPTYIANEVMSISTQTIAANTSSSCSITGSSNNGKAQTIIYQNNSSSDVTVTVPTTYKTPDGEEIELTCLAGGYCEVNYLNIGGTIYARGL